MEVKSRDQRRTPSSDTFRYIAQHFCETVAGAMGAAMNSSSHDGTPPTLPGDNNSLTISEKCLSQFITGANRGDTPESQAISPTPTTSNCGRFWTMKKAMTRMKIYQFFNIAAILLYSSICLFSLEKNDSNRLYVVNFIQPVPENLIFAGIGPVNMQFLNLEKNM